MSEAAQPPQRNEPRPQHDAVGQEARDDRARDAVERQPLDRTKPPREWRSRESRPQGPAARPDAEVTGPARQSEAPSLGRPVHPDAAAQPETPPEADRRPAPTPTAATTTAPSATPPRVAPTTAAPTAAPMSSPTEDVDPGGATNAEPFHELPRGYGADRLVLFIRDPRCCYACWELTPATRGRMGVPVATLVLRFYDVTGVEWDGRNHHGTFDASVRYDSGSCYVELDRPGSSFIAELGLRAPNGGATWMIRSNRIDLPRAGPSPDIDPDWPLLVGAPARFRMTERDLRPAGSSDEWPSSPASHPGPSRDESS